MDEKLTRAISEFVTRRINDLGTDAPETVTDAVTEAESRRENLEAALTAAQASLLRALENSLDVRAGEEARYYYRAGFLDAVRFLLEWSDVE